MQEETAVFEHSIILAGGAGNRLWPVSTNERPKYLLEISPDTSLLRATLMRAAAVTRSKIVIVTHYQHAPVIIKQVEEDGHDWGRKPGQQVVVLLEPQAKNTAPAVALATHYLNTHADGGATLCMPADHIINPLAVFAEDVTRAHSLVKEQYITLFGIRPQSINTGYGHLEAGSALGDERYAIKKFHEKPDHDTAKQYMERGDFYWNSGLYAFDTAHIWQEYRTHESRITSMFQMDAEKSELFSFKAHSPSLIVQQMTDRLRAVYSELPAISIDYSIGERSKRVAMISARFAWNDIGSWDEIARLIDQQQIDNPKLGSTALLDGTQNNTIISDLPVAICGVNDIIVVVEDGIVMVCKKGTSQEVKKLALKYEMDTAVKPKADDTPSLSKDVI